jgi:molecular chaperone GrpE
MTDDTKKDWGKVRDKLQQEEPADKADEELSAEPTMSALENPSYQALEEKLTRAEQLAHENWEKSIRAVAEVDNIRRRTEREVTNAHRYGLEKFVTSLIPVVDSLEQALQLAIQHGDDAMREGIQLTTKLMIDTLEKHGVKQLDPMGDAFDPQMHEAMSMQPSDTAEPNSVIAVFQKGYELNGRVIRPARVVVAKG